MRSVSADQCALISIQDGDSQADCSRKEDWELGSWWIVSPHDQKNCRHIQPPTSTLPYFYPCSPSPPLPASALRHQFKHVVTDWKM